MEMTSQWDFKNIFDGMKLGTVSQNIDTWLDDRGITKNGSAMGQAIKTLEECTELLDAINHNNRDEIEDAIGDIYVTIRGVSKVLDIPFNKCVDRAYEEIKDRRGFVSPGGTFVKYVTQQPDDPGVEPEETRGF